MAALDKKLREETQFELTDLQAKLGITFLTVTHDQDEAMVLADRIGVMDQGRIVQIGSPAEVYEAPNSRLVANFLGDINLFEGAVQAEKPPAIKLTGADGAFQTVAANAPAAGETVWLAVRPEKIRISPAPPPKGAVNVLAGEIFDIGYLGDWTTYVVEIRPGRRIRVAQANATRIVEHPLSWGDKVWLSFDADAGIILTR